MLLLLGIALVCAIASASTPQQEKPISYFNIYYNYRGYPSYYPGSVYGNQPYVPIFGGHVTYPYNYYTHRYPEVGYPRDYSVKDIFESPILIVVKADKGYNVYLAEKGLYSIYHESYLKSVRSYLQTQSDKTLVVFQPSTYYNSKFFNANVNQLVTPESFKFGDFTKWLNYFYQIPVLVAFEKGEYETYHFENVVNYGKYGVYPEYIGPIVEEYTPSH